MTKRIYIIIIGFILLMFSCKENYSMKNPFIINESILSESNQETNSSETVGQTERVLQTIKPKDYDISTETFNNTNENKQIKISIQYPQIAKLTDAVLQDSINELIKEAALSPYSYIVNSNGGIANGTEWPVGYSIMYADNHVLSIKFEGYIYAQGSAHGTNWVYPINVNLATGKKITINELFDDSFKDKLNHQCFNGIDVDTKKSDETTINEIFDRLKNNFTKSDDNFYFTNNKFIVILPIDDYYQFAASYEDLKSSMKENNSIWRYILDGNF